MALHITMVTKKPRAQDVLALFVCIFLLPFSAEGFVLCSTSCEEGQLCDGSSCKPCPEGQYQKEPIHEYPYCILWSTKPPQSNYVITKNGTSKSDREWKCKDGYQERQYTTDGFECVIITTLPPTSIITEITTGGYIPTSVVLSSITPPAVEQTNNFTEKVVATVICSSVILGIVVVAVYLCWREKKLCFKNARFRCKVHKTNGGIPAADCNGDIHDSASESLLHKNDVIFNKFFLRIVKTLGPDKTIQFIRLLPDVSTKFNADVTIQTEFHKSHDPEVYLPRCFSMWNRDREKINRELFEDIFEEVGRPGELGTILKDKESNFLEILDVETVHVRPTCSGDETSFTNMSKKIISRPDRYKLFYYLAAKFLTPDPAERMLHQLSTNKFDAHKFFKTKLSQTDFVNALAESLEELWLRHWDQSLRNLVNVLKEMELNVILYDKEFNKRLEKVFSAKTDNVDISQDPEQGSLLFEKGPNELHSVEAVSREVPFDEIDSSAQTVPKVPLGKTVPKVPSEETVPKVPSEETVPKVLSEETVPTVPLVESVPKVPRGKSVPRVPLVETAH